MSLNMRLLYGKALAREVAKFVSRIAERASADYSWQNMVARML